MFSMCSKFLIRLADDARKTVQSSLKFCQSFVPKGRQSFFLSCQENGSKIKLYQCVNAALGQLADNFGLINQIKEAENFQLNLR